MSRMHLSLPISFNNDSFWRCNPLRLSVPTPVTASADINGLQLPKSLGSDPRTWNRDDVVIFLQWCKSEFDLPALDLDKFKLNGKALILLGKCDISNRAPGTGDIIHNILQLLLKSSALLRPSDDSISSPEGHGLRAPLQTPTSAGWPAQHSPLFAAADLHKMMQQRNSVALSPTSSTETSSQAGMSPSQAEHTAAVAAAAVAAHLSFYTQALQARMNAAETHSDSEEELRESSPRRSSPPPVSRFTKVPSSPSLLQLSSENAESAASNNGRLLWDFLQQLLNDPGQRYASYIAWKNRETGVFKITDPAGLARLWGYQKNHPSMNYDKMSRALRYYYRVNILRKVQGERHCYQFLRNNAELKSIKNISQLRQQTISGPSGLSKTNERSDIPSSFDYPIPILTKPVP